MKKIEVLNVDEIEIFLLKKMIKKYRDIDEDIIEDIRDDIVDQFHKEL